jgi:hypothetical protein
VVPVGRGLGPGDAIDPTETDTPLSDAVAVLDETGDQPGKGAILLPPRKIRQEGAVRPSQFVRFLGWGPQTSNVEFTDLTEDGFRITALKEGRFVYLDGFTMSGSDENQRSGGSAIHFISEEVSPKQFNMGYMAFRDWIDPVLHFEKGSPYDSTWQHLDFGWDGNRGREIVLEENQSLMGTQIGYISAGNSTGDTVFWTNFAGARLRIGFMNVGGSAGQAARIWATQNGHVHIGGINFESGVSVENPIVELRGPAAVKLGHVKNTDSTVDSIVQLTQDNANNIIEHVRNFRNFGARLNVGPIEIADEPQGPSYYFGPSENVVNSAEATTNKFWALGDMRAADGGLRAGSTVGSSVNRYTQASADDLSTGELGLDVDRDGDGTPALVFKDDDGTLYRWDGQLIQ